MAEITVVRSATPSALPTCRAVLNSVDALPVAAWLIVANAAAWDGAKTWATQTPRPNISTRTIYRLVEKPIKVNEPMIAAMPSKPATSRRRGPIVG